MGPLARIRAIAAAAMFLTAVAVAGTYLLLPSPSLDRGRSVSVLVFASDGSILRGFLTGDGKWRLPVEPAEGDPLYPPTLIAAGDPRFSSPIRVGPIAGLRAPRPLAIRAHVGVGAPPPTMHVAR